MSDNICRTVDWAELDAALDLVASENQCHEQHGSSLPQAVAGVREAVPVAGTGEAVAGAEVVEEVGVVQEAGEVGVVKEAGDVGVVEEAGDVEVVEEAVGAGAAFVVRGNAVGPRKKRGQRAQKWGLQKEADEGRGGGRGAGAEEVLAPEVTFSNDRCAFFRVFWGRVSPVCRASPAGVASVEPRIYAKYVRQCI